MIHFFIAEEYEDKINAIRLEEAALAALASQERSSDTGFSIVVDSDEYIAQLNEEYRGISAPTDVLSFGYEMIDPETEETTIGDIIISYERAEAQAKLAGHPVLNELVLLVVHGVLHLIGFDHAEDAERERMWIIQAEILNSIGCQINRLPED